MDAHEYSDGWACPASVANAWCATEIGSTAMVWTRCQPLRLLGWAADAVHFESLLDEFIAIEDVSAVEDEGWSAHVL